MAKISRLQEFYIRENINKLSVDELVKVTGLSIKVINNFAKKILNDAAKASTEEVISPVSQHESSVTSPKQKTDALKRMTPVKGVTVMTEEMSAKGEKPQYKKVTTAFKKSIHKMYEDE